MKKQFFTLMLLLATGTVFAQSGPGNSSLSSSKKTTTTQTITESTSGNQSYIGVSGGYLFKNNKIFDHPMWYLDNGQFLELNVGTRGQTFGWSASFGYLTISRANSQFDKIWLNNRMMYDSIGGGTQPTGVTSGLDDHSISFSPDGKTDTSLSKPFRGFYLMTGPNIWFGEGKLKFNLAIEAGIGFSQAGYYYAVGYAKQGNGTATITAQGPSGKAAAYDVSVLGVQYRQYGMSRKYYDKISSSTLTNRFDEKEPYEIHPMARAAANVEYFVTPRLSIHGGANLWYIFSPGMTGEQDITIESARYKNSGNGMVEYAHNSRYTQPFEKKDLMMASVNVGVKFWFGRPRQSKKVVTTTEQTNTKYERLKQAEKTKEENPLKAKPVIVTVVDRLTKTPMGGVEVVLKGQNGHADMKAVTKSNGTVELDNVKPGNYAVNGEIYSIATTNGNINSSAFSDGSPAINTTLYYEDPRFILKGVAINTDDGSTEEGVKVSLEQGSDKVSHTMTNTDGNFHFLLQTNSDYQIQGLKNGYYSNIAEASTKGLKRSQTLFVKLKLGMNTVAVGRTFVVKNIHYNFDDASIRPDAALELGRLAAFLNENPDVRIELSSHTDSRGNNTYNLKLSQRRAQSAVDYLIAKGITRSRLVAKGYGETRLVNGCKDGIVCTDAQQEANRRTEIKIIK